MPTFVHPTLLWGMAIIALPVLIHLINMMRHKRVHWAAMEFLIASQKKHRTWIIFKQLLLLLMRMAIIAAIVLLVAQPLLRHQWSGIFGGSKTHYVVLLDDSFSMSDHWDDTSAFAEAKRVVERIGDEAAKNTRSCLFTLLPFSHSAKNQSVQNDLTALQIGGDFKDKLAESLKKLAVSQTAVGPADVLRTVGQIIGEAEDERRILYIVSDFRAKEWNEPAEIKKSLRQWQSTEGNKVRLVNCIDRIRPNLAIDSLKPEEGISAAGVPWFMDVAVTNYGKTLSKDVTVSLSEDGRARPSVIIAEIPPGRTVKERFQVNYSAEGRHEIVARLESDAVAADNSRYFTVDLPDDVPVLLIDGGAQSKDARYLSLAAAPGGSVRTGLRPQIETPRALGLKSLDYFRAIILTNIERLDASAVKSLEKYAASGGGVAFFLGESSQTKFFNDDLFRDGKGLFPIRLKGPAELPIDRLETAPDVEVERHFIFRIFAERRNTFLNSVIVQHYFSAADDWKTSADPALQVLARLRNGIPLVVEKPFGKGRVVAFLTTAAPTWNNWAKNPSFVVVLQDLQAYLSHRETGDAAQLVGEPLELSLDPAKYQAQIRFVTPHESDSPSATTDATVSTEGRLVASLSDTALSGYYEARLTKTDNSADVRSFAINVDPAEGNLAALDKIQLADRLKGLKYEYEQASMFQSSGDESAGGNLSDAILCALVILLIGEQILAWSAGYHPSSLRTAAAGGGK